MAVAERAARAYAGNGKLAALAVAGSVGAGLADRFSDLELDCYWSSPPGDDDRTGPIGALGGELTGFWEYDEDDQEWSEDYLLGDLGVTVSNFLTGTVERFLDDVVLRADTGPVKHMRLAAIQRSRPLLGAELITSWRARADDFPGGLASALVQLALDPEMLTGWAARDAVASRGDDLAAQDLLTRAGHAVVRALLAVNRVYLPHRQIKWQHHLITGLEVVPERRRLSGQPKPCWKTRYCWPKRTPAPISAHSARPWQNAASRSIHPGPASDRSPPIAESEPVTAALTARAAARRYGLGRVGRGGVFARGWLDPKL